MIGDIFKYIHNKKGKPIPLEFKLIHNLLTEDELYINGDLDLWFSKIKSLPDNLTINGYLDLEASNISVLPNNLYVTYDLDIDYTNISDLPNDIYVGGNLYCYNTKLAERIMNDFSLLKKYQKKVKGEIQW